MFDQILRLPQLWADRATAAVQAGGEVIPSTGEATSTDSKGLGSGSQAPVDVSHGKGSNGNGTMPTFQTPYVPLPIRWGNALSRHLDLTARPWTSLELDSLLENAERSTGLTRWGDSDFLESLAALVDSINGEGKLTLFGRIALRQFLSQHLSNRLRVVDALERFPEIRDVEIEKPVFIVGWYRTGTTLLHNLLAGLPHLRAPLFWELRHPCPEGDPRRQDIEPIIRGVRRTRRIHRYLSPHFDTAHPMMAELPEECLHLFENAGISATSFFISEMKSFAWWLLKRDLRPAYRFYRSQLQLLQWLRPGRRWVLKWPYHLWHLDALLDVFPDARIIHTHRNPLKAVPSVCSLAALSRSPMCEAIDAGALGRFWLDYNAAGLERGLTARAAAPAEQFADVDHARLVRDPVGTIKRIHDNLGLELPPDAPQLIESYIAAHPRHKNGIHRYRLEQFGLGETEVTDRFKPYVDRLPAWEETVA